VVGETDPQAVALGYKADASKVDKAKYAKYVAGGCSLFVGKQVAGPG
jgi:hypothetical protein